jgi:hypothetical protein
MMEKVCSSITTSQHLFPSERMNWPNKLECYITSGWEGLPGTSTLS